MIPEATPELYRATADALRDFARSL